MSRIVDLDDVEPDDLEHIAQLKRLDQYRNVGQPSWYEQEE